VEALKRLLGPLASLRLTVALFSFSMVLILAGTLAQVRDGVWTVVDQYFRSLWVLIPLQLFVPERVLRLPGVVPWPGGTTLGTLLFINLLAAHAVRFKLSWKRCGIILVHAGALLLLVGEFVTGIGADEGNMSINEGSSSSFVEDIREAELAVIDASGEHDRVTVVSQRALEHAAGAGPDAQNRTISLPLLPFSVRVDRWMSNSRLLGPVQSTPEQRAQADSGLGTQLAAAPAPRATGVDGLTVDTPSAYIAFVRDGRAVGSYLLSLHIETPQSVQVDGKIYQVSLRFRRTYKPYSIHLLDFRHDKSVGTKVARNFSSRVRLVDSSRSVDRELTISMNKPLRYAGDTLYQSSYMHGDVGTVLQVVRNPGWLIPYISCSMVTLGLLIHFLARLGASARRAAK
jgi:hypothetical protein